MRFERSRLNAIKAKVPAHLQSYQMRVEAYRQTPYLDYPAHVHFETLAKCNAACVFCPYPTMERKGTMMPDALIAKVIGDLQDIPSTLSFQLSVFKVSEPFLDVRLFDIIGDINAKLPNATITLTSNASPITEDKLAQLAKIKKCGYLWISFNDHREKEYEATMKLPYKRTIERLNLIHQKRSSGELNIRIVLSRIGDSTSVDQEFVQWVRINYPLFETSIFPRGNWLGQTGAPDLVVPNVGCSRWFDLSITATGTVAHCCMDGKAEYPIGDVNTQHCLDIYNAPHYRQLRESTFTRADAIPCNRCSFL